MENQPLFFTDIQQVISMNVDTFNKMQTIVMQTSGAQSINL